MAFLVTGAAGFIGFHTVKLLAQNYPDKTILGIDNLNAYYDVNLKLSRLKALESVENFAFHKIDLLDHSSLTELFKIHKITKVIHLAAQAGVRYSLENPESYIQSNLVGFGNILEIARTHSIEHLLYASSSSVYGANSLQPFSPSSSTEHPLSLYAATKKSNEMMAHAYAHLFRLPCTGLRFFTVYGPWGRPDMALFKFTKQILAGEPIEVYNHGRMSRDFTYVGDVCNAIAGLIEAQPPTPNPNWNSDKPDPASSNAPYSIVNVGSDNPVTLMAFIEAIELALGKKATLNFLPLQDGDVPNTHADISYLKEHISYKTKTALNDGVKNFVDWYLTHYDKRKS